MTQLLSTAPTATRGDEDAVQNNHAFDNGAKGREAIHAGQSLSSLFVGSAAEAVAAGKAIWWEGDKNHLVQVEEGVVRLLRIIGEGRRVIIALQFAGDLNGASLQNDFLFTAEAVTKCKIRRISHMSFHGEVARSNALARAYLSLLCQEAAASHEQMVLLPKKNAEERPCSFIVKLAFRRNPRPRQGPLRVSMNRQDIADHLGLTIETLAHTVTKLASRNIVIPEGRHDLRNVNLARLVRLSGDTDDFSEDFCQRVNLNTRDKPRD
uniref:FixK n=1 Tax=Rhizobium etli TaxID=29449 RepID=P95599_RHIET|nr:FixK [Rhizobium etli]